MGVFLSILELGRHMLLGAHDITFVIPTFNGWEVFSTLKALTHIIITWGPLTNGATSPECHFDRPIYICIWNFPLVGSQWLDVDFHS